MAVAADARTGESLTTQRRVQGTITAVDAAHLTIAPAGAPGITGRLDPKRTTITINGRKATPGELQVTAHAHAEMGLDDVWVSIQVSPN